VRGSVPKGFRAVQRTPDRPFPAWIACTGFKARDLDRLAGLLGALAADESPFTPAPPAFVLSKTVVTGDGQRYTSVPGRFDDWTGSVVGWVHSIRYFDGDVQIKTITENNSTKETGFEFDDYAASGQQYINSSLTGRCPGSRWPA